MNLSHKIFSAVFTLSVLASSAVVHADHKSNSSGPNIPTRHIGTHASSGDRTSIRANTGASAGSAFTHGNQTTFRDASGRTTTTANQSRNMTTFRDAQGRTTANATTSGATPQFRDAAGRSLGSSQSSQGRTDYRDSTVAVDPKSWTVGDAG